MIDSKGCPLSVPETGLWRRREREALRLEHLLAHSLGVERAVIEQRAHLGFLASLADDGELLLGAIVLAGEAEELEEEGAAVGVGGIVPKLGAQRIDRFVELAGLQKIAWSHGEADRWNGNCRPPLGGGRIASSADRSRVGACQQLRGRAQTFLLAFRSQPAFAGESSVPSAFCGLYSYSILVKLSAI